MSSENVRRGLTRTLAIGGAGVTLMMNPWSNYDPINLPKLFFLVPFACTTLTLSLILLVNRKLEKFDFFLFLFLFIYTLFLFVNATLVSGNSAQSIWGTWGRNTGAVAYFCLSAILVSSALMDTSGAKSILVYFSRLSYVVSGYTLIQYLGLDPISWGQQLPFATLGNINFMSSFLGMATALFIAKIVFERQTLASKVHFVFFILLNFFLILQSGSIQGIGIMGAAISVVLVTYFWEKRRSLLAALTTFSLFTVGLVMVMGVAGMGPLGKQLIQQTVLYRFDYWGAGWKMFTSSPIWGLGMDSFGDFYREFRSDTATQRTGPARVANTAHNIFLDLMSGGGLLGVSFLVVAFLVTLSWAVKRIAQRTAPLELYQLLPIVVGFLLFCLISINQLGVGVWGYLFLGAALSVLRKGRGEDRNKIDGKSNFKKGQTSTQKAIPSSRLTRGRAIAIIGAAFALFATSSTFQQVAIDAGFLRAYKSADIQTMSDYINSFAPTGFYEDKLLVMLTSKGFDSEAIDIAESIVKRDKRQFTAWSVIAYSNLALKERRIEAKRVLLQLDPFNRQLAKELSEMGL